MKELYAKVFMYVENKEGKSKNELEEELYKLLDDFADKNGISFHINDTDLQ
ncbi:hypothetical protein [Paenibacillus sp. Marseille-Q4541]|uniref:hypothetical protein n=1 Tax=Paenibacillus sp. Marseille-Q4541 TaxID=2831522 RepID=UPI001BA450D7|nr:hypothetical protein [Paenibacillus sp. Marseille-Q4541]